MSDPTHVQALCEIMVRFGIEEMHAGDVKLRRPAHAIAAQAAPNEEEHDATVDQETFLGWPPEKQEAYLRGVKVQ